MKEVTIVANIQVTAIAKVTDEEAAILENDHQGGSPKALVSVLTGEIEPDDIQLLDSKIFIRDAE